MTCLSQCTKERATDELRFGCDGWNLIGTLNSQLSTPFQPSTSFVSYDGNGNVAALFGSSGESARYEYGPFGEVIRATGPMAKANPFRFSTKYQDDETDLLHYGYRYYNGSTGRWLSRDPLEEELGGANLYSFVSNDPMNELDPFGLQKFEFEIARGKNGWGEPPKFFRDSSASVGSSSATTTLIGHGPDSGFCCNTPHKPQYADNLDGGSIVAYMTDAPKGTYHVYLDFSGSASVDASDHDKDDPYFHAGAVLKFSATGQGQVLYGRVSGPGERAQSRWAGSRNAVATVSVKRKSDRVEVGRYNVQMGLDKCLGVTVTAEGTVAVTGHARIK